MAIALAYGAVILIWSTTPLAIHWSNSDLDFISAISARIVLAALLGMALFGVMRWRLVEKRSDWLQFAAGALGLFPTMLMVYWAAQRVPSGLMSVIFGLFPFWAGLGSLLILKQSVFTPLKIAALAVAVCGLAIINYDQLHDGIGSALGVAAIVMATICWSLSSILLKALPAIPPLRQSIGSCVLAAPLFALVWWAGADALPTAIGMKSLLGIGYLVLVGSLIGHTLFVYVLARCTVVTVSLIPLLAPILAILLGWWFEGETLGATTLLGVTILLVALAIYQGLIPVDIIAKRVKRSFGFVLNFKNPEVK